MSRPIPFPLGRGTTHVEREYPHIVERLRLLWGYPEGSRYLNELILDTRGGRAGFSPAVMDELLEIANLPGNPGDPLGGPGKSVGWGTAQLGV